MCSVGVLYQNVILSVCMRFCVISVYMNICTNSSSRISVFENIEKLVIEFIYVYIHIHIYVYIYI